MEPMNLSSGFNAFAPTILNGSLVYCSDARLQGLRKDEDLQGASQVHWYFASEGDRRTLSASFANEFHHLGPGVQNPATGRWIFTAARKSAAKRDTSTLSLYTAMADANGVLMDIQPLVFSDAVWLNDANVAHPAVSPDGEWLCFSSNYRAAGSADLFISKKEVDHWGTPKRMSAKVNSESGEYFPTFAPNGWLYFASDRKGGKGGYDLYFSYLLGGEWSSAQRLENDLNSPSDDYGMAFLSDGMSGYFSSDREGGMGDIFAFELAYPDFDRCKPALPEPVCYLIEETAIQHSDTLPVYYEWDFGDGATARGLSNEHCFPGIGEYDVALNIYDTLTGAHFARVSELQISILPAGVPFIQAPDTVRINEAVYFAADTAELNGFLTEGFYWKSGDGRKFKGVEAAWGYPAPGVYEVALAAMAPPVRGFRDHRCGVQQIVVIDPDEPGIALGEPEAQKIQLPRVLSEVEEHVRIDGDDRVYFIEFHQSQWQLALSDPYFKDVPFEIVERFQNHDSLYHYSVGEARRITELYSVQREMTAAGYPEAIVMEEAIEQFKEDTRKRGSYYTDEEKLQMNRYIGQLSDIRFDVNSKAIRKESTRNLEKILQILQMDESLMLQISAHTDDRGTDEYNLELSENRANAVVQYFVESGIESGRLQARGFGNRLPIADNQSEKGRARNRRVEFRLIFIEK